MSTIERIFSDLRTGLELEYFAVARHDAGAPLATDKITRRFVEAMGAKPRVFGPSIALMKALFSHLRKKVTQTD